MINQERLSLIYRITIGSFLSVCVCLALVGQDLEEVEIPQNRVQKTILNTVDNPENKDREILSSEVDLPRDPDTYRKNVYIEKMLRHTYYHRLTTSPWSKFLKPKGWRNNVQKWRYWDHLKTYLTGDDKDIIILREPDKSKPQVQAVQEPIDSGEEQIAPEIGAIDTEAHQIIKEESTDIVEMDTSSSDTQTSIPYEELTISETEPTIPIDLDTIVEQVDGQSSTDIFVQIIGHDAFVQEAVAPWIIQPDSIDVMEEDVSDEVNSIESIEELEKTSIETKEDLLDKEETVSAQNYPASKEKGKIQETVSEELNTEEVTISPPPNPSTTSPRTNENLDVSNTGLPPEAFGSLRGSLPWPVQGRITDRFGSRANAEARGLSPNNFGIDMLCPAGAGVHAVHDGTVLLARRQSPYDIIVTIKHGEYTSAYYYLIEPYVKQGEVVKAGQRIGRLRTSVEEADFHFEIWYNQERLNPELWLK